MSAARIGVKYCGGCRAMYDRKAGFEDTRVAFVAGCPAPAAEFVHAEDGGSYDALLVLCGCPAKCADISKYIFGGQAVTVDSRDGYLWAADELLKTLAGRR